jgi:hypothetical protein
MSSTGHKATNIKISIYKEKDIYSRIDMCFVRIPIIKDGSLFFFKISS